MKYSYFLFGFSRFLEPLFDSELKQTIHDIEKEGDFEILKMKTQTLFSTC